jgi:phosphoribosylamine--glycine ligase
MKILVVGGGGREHALIWKIARCGSAGKLYAAPGNPGIAEHAECIPLKAEDVTGIAKFAVSEGVDLVAVGPEAPLCMGITDILGEAGVLTVGPSAGASAIEGSKAFAKNLMRKYRIPTAAFETFGSARARTRGVPSLGYSDAREFARALGGDMWVKASGLAAGKGAVYASNPDEAERILRDMMVKGVFGESGREVVVEENMHGEEASIFAVCDGSGFKTLVSSQDHKRVFDGDRGPNTGGMGAYAPAPVVSPEFMESIRRDILQKVLDGMASEGVPYRGLLYAGIMATAEGPKVVEFNCRFGDPETQAVLPLLDGDLVEIMEASARGRLADVHVGERKGSALCVVVASGGYPGSYEKGRRVSGLDDAERGGNVKVFHAGTALDGDAIVTAGGRVFGVTGWGDTFAEARERAYEAAAKISFTGAFYRGDIGHRALAYFDKTPQIM